MRYPRTNKPLMYCGTAVKKVCRHHHHQYAGTILHIYGTHETAAAAAAASTVIPAACCACVRSRLAVCETLISFHARYINPTGTMNGTSRSNMAHRHLHDITGTGPYMYTHV